MPSIGGMQLVISGNDYALADFAGMLKPDRMRMALSVGVNATVKQARTKAAQEITKAGSIKREYVERGLTINPYATPASLQAKLRGSGRPLTLKAFGPSQNSRGVTVTVWGKRQFYRHAFISQSLNSHVYVRLGRKRLPIHRMYGAGVAQVMAEVEVEHALRRYGQARLEINIARQLDRYAAGAGGANRGR